jgi:hypothetical protein
MVPQCFFLTPGRDSSTDLLFILRRDISTEFFYSRKEYFQSLFMPGKDISTELFWEGFKESRAWQQKSQMNKAARDTEETVTLQ